jgi:uncharacterized membrane protein
MSVGSTSHSAVAIAMATALVSLIAIPLVGWPAVTRLPALVVPVIAVAIAAARPWRCDVSQWSEINQWTPSRRLATVAACSAVLVIFWLVLTRFQSGSINAVDFTVYFDRPCYQTVNGRPLFVETADVPSFSYRSQFAVHAMWIMVPVCVPYAMYPTPLWLLSLSVIAVVVGALYVSRIAAALGVPAVVAVAGALAFVLNDNTARALNYGFHVEILYAWFIPWAIDAGIGRARWSFLLASICSVLVKEDAVLPLAGVAFVLGTVHWRRFSIGDIAFFLILPVALSVANLLVYYRYVLPALTQGGGPTYVSFWANYGPTPAEAAIAMVRDPIRVLVDTLRSGFLFSVLPVFLFLPLIAWRWTAAVLPIVLLYGASANEQLRQYGIYYAIVLVPFLTVGAIVGAFALTRRVLPVAYAPATAAAVVLAGALLVGSTRAGYSLRPWRAEVASMPATLQSTPAAQRVLVQSALYPHAGYDERVRLLTPLTLKDPANAGALVLLAPALSAYPFTAAELDKIARSPTRHALPSGIVTVQLAEAGEARSAEPAR